MKIQIHFFTALVGSVAIYFVTSGNLLASSLFFTSSFLIDADHALDYVLIYKRIDVLRMLKGHFYKDRIYVFLHSAEIPIIALLVWPGMYSAVFAAGYLLHLAMDVAEYPFRNPLLTYFLSYRLAVGFSKQKLCSKSDNVIF